MEVTAIGCCHGAYNQLKLAGGDLLIVSGDLTARDTNIEYQKFFQWLKVQDYKKKIFIGGNHDNKLIDFYCTDEELKSYEYLCDSGIEFEYKKETFHPNSTRYVSIDSLCYDIKKLKIWGIPHSLSFPGINPECTAYCGDEAYMKKYCDLIPDDIDILISHSPPYGILDGIEIMDGSLFHTGSHELLKACMRVKPKYFICSHIHEQGGKMIDLTSGIYINCSIMNENYNPVNKPITFKFKK